MRLPRFLFIFGVLAAMIITLSGCSRIVGELLAPAIEEAVEPVVKQIAAKTLREVTEKAIREAAQQAAAETAERAVRETTEALASEAIQQSSAEALEASVKRTAGIGVVADFLSKGRTSVEIVEALGRQGDATPIIHALPDGSHLVTLNSRSFRILEGEIIPVPEPTIIALGGQEQLLKVNQEWLWTDGKQINVIHSPLDIMTPAKMRESYLSFAPAEQGDTTWSLVARDQAPQAERLIEVEYTINQRTVKALVDPKTGAHYIAFDEFPTDADAILKQIQHSFTSFDQDIRDMNYRGLARDLTDPTGNGLELLALDLKRKLDSVDALLDSGSYDDALTLLDSMTALHGDSPEILLRKSTALIKKRDAARLVTELNESPIRQLMDSDAYFDEINLRLSDGTLSGPLERENIQHVGQMAEWNDLHAQNNIAGQVKALATDDGRVTLLYGIGDDLSGTRIVKDNLSYNPNAVYYTDDAPGIYSLNLDVSSETSLRQLVEGELTEVIELPRGDIAHFRPVLIYRGKYDEALSTINKDYPNIKRQLAHSAEREGAELSTRKFYESYEQARETNATQEEVVYLISTRAK